MGWHDEITFSRMRRAGAGPAQFPAASCVQAAAGQIFSGANATRATGANQSSEGALECTGFPVEMHPLACRFRMTCVPAPARYVSATSVAIRFHPASGAVGTFPRTPASDTGQPTVHCTRLHADHRVGQGASCSWAVRPKGSGRHHRHVCSTVRPQRRADIHRGAVRRGSVSF